MEYLQINTVCLKISQINQIFYYIRCIAPKRVTSLRYSSPRRSNTATVLTKMLKQWRTVSNAVENLACPGFELQTSRTRDALSVRPLRRLNFMNIRWKLCIMTRKWKKNCLRHLCMFFHSMLYP